MNNAPRAIMLRAMVTGPKILLLAGSFEARRVAEALTARGIGHCALLTEPPRGEAPMPQAPELRVFGDAPEMAEWVRAQGVTAVLDASHVFDRTLTAQGWDVAGRLGLPYLRLERPAWGLEHARWRRVADVAASLPLIRPGARVFAATGWDSLPDFAGFPGARLMLRQTRRHDRPAPYPFVDLVFGDPPFTAASEKALFRARAVDLLICRNLGGRASRPKLDAALALKLDVILIDRPAPPPGLPVVADVAKAVAWACAL